jgi:hypothetical protein
MVFSVVKPMLYGNISKTFTLCFWGETEIVLGGFYKFISTMAAFLTRYPNNISASAIKAKLVASAETAAPLPYPYLFGNVGNKL